MFMKKYYNLLQCYWRPFHVSGRYFCLLITETSWYCICEDNFYNIKMRINLSFWMYQYYQWPIFYFCVIKNLSGIFNIWDININTFNNTLKLPKWIKFFVYAHPYQSFNYFQMVTLSWTWIKISPWNHSCILELLLLYNITLY